MANQQMWQRFVWRYLKAERTAREKPEEINFTTNKPRTMEKEPAHFEPLIIAFQAQMERLFGSDLEYVLVGRLELTCALEVRGKRRSAFENVPT
ncbi:hypothetical protein AVEN_132868-1 [Araneus ventricosus]|uniref:Uncharacterized protein n=1 Tax=Araneus ventricosus TaxID=182803 RepID=A0A4Y2GUE6_ARAVE|nr:hypothetical protein AVEN_132868-1 [Araneus ventricosus]